MTQKEAVLKYIEDNGSITPKQGRSGDKKRVGQG